LSKNAIQRAADMPPPVKVGGTPPSSGLAVDYAPPATGLALDAPDNMALTTAIVASTASPLARINATWDDVGNMDVERYAIQFSADSNFPVDETLTVYSQSSSVSMDGFPQNRLYYVRVAAVTRGGQGPWSSMSPLVTGQNRITTAIDLSPAAQPSGLAGSWIGTGDLLITWTNPANANFLEVELKIYTASGGVLLRTENRQGGSFLYQVHLNLYDTGGAGDFSLYIEARSRTYSNVLNNTSPPTLSTTKPAPTTPSSVAHSWSGETDHAGVAPADWVLTWTRSDSAARYRVTIDSVAYLVSGQADQFAYPLALNRSQHSGTPDPILSYAIVALDAFGQASSAVSGTATNEDPPAPSITLTQGAVGGLYATIAGTLASDFVAYEIVWKRDGTTVATVESAAANQSYEQQGTGDDGYHSWTAVVRQKDAFGQYSQTTTSSAVAFEAMTLAGLRSSAAYTDSNGNSAATLAALKDGTTTSGGVSYNP
jgi:hypothetical protein